MRMSTRPRYLLFMEKMRMLSRIKSAVVLALSIAPFVAFAYTSPGVPSGFVNDFAGVFEAGRRSALETQLSDFEKRTGAQIAIVTVQSLGDETVETYAVKLFEEWGIGQKGKDNGALVLLAVEDRKMRIEVGYGLEGSLTDAFTASVVRNVLTPAFKAGDFMGGLEQGVSLLMQAVESGEVAVPNSDRGRSFSGSFSSIFFIALFFIRMIFISLARTKSWWLGGVFGGIGAGVAGFIFGSLAVAGIGALILIPLGLLFDYLVSRSAGKILHKDYHMWWGSGPFGGGHGGGGGFGGFGGGRSGGGGSSGGF